MTSRSPPSSKSPQVVVAQTAPPMGFATRIPVYGDDPLRAPTPPTSSTPTRPHPIIGTSRGSFSLTSSPASSTSPSPERSPRDESSTSFSSSSMPASQTHTVATPPSPLASTSSPTSEPNSKKKQVVNEATQDMKGLKALMEVGAWREGSKLAEQLLEQCTNPETRLQLKLCAVICLMKLRNWAAAAAHIQALGDLDDPIHTYEHYYSQKDATTKGEQNNKNQKNLKKNEEEGLKQKRKQGSMVPFSLRILNAELPSFAGNVMASLDMLYGLLAYCRNQIRLVSGEEEANELAAKKQELEVAAKEKTDANKGEAKNLEEEDKVNEVGTEIDLSVSVDLNPEDLQGLLVDSSNGGEKNVLFSSTTLNRAPSLIFSTEENEPSDKLRLWRRREVRIQFSIATRLVQKKDYMAAIAVLHEMVEQHPQDAVLLSALGRVHLLLGDIETATDVFYRVEQQLVTADADRSFLVLMNRGYAALAMDEHEHAVQHFKAALELAPTNLAAANNLALSLLFACSLGQAVALLERLLAQSPEQSLHETLVFNLCTMYDILSNAESGTRKKRILSLVAQHASDDFDIGVLKLSPS
ncbi:hypothetical protein QOT17_004020 [Balamuthia mandrillaris]